MLAHLNPALEWRVICILLSYIIFWWFSSVKKINTLTHTVTNWWPPHGSAQECFINTLLVAPLTSSVSSCGQEGNAAALLFTSSGESVPCFVLIDRWLSAVFWFDFVPPSSYLFAQLDANVLSNIIASRCYPLLASLYCCISGWTSGRGEVATVLV